MRTARRRLAWCVWGAALGLALLLAAGAVLATLFVDRETVVVRQVLAAAKVVAGPFDGLLTFYRDPPGPGAQVHDLPKEDLVNWGSGAVVYLVVGGLLDRLLRPRPRPAPVEAAHAPPEPATPSPGDS